LSRVIFIRYLGATMEDFNILYGPLTLGVVLLFWAWVVAIRPEKGSGRFVSSLGLGLKTGIGPS
jgi:hypothetical protein